MLKTIDRKLGNKIAGMAFVCMMLVVVQHLPNGAWVNDNLGIFTSIAVPFFFMISGFFLASHCDEPDWWTRALRKRTLSLLVPYAFFNLTWHAYLCKSIVPTLNLGHALGMDLMALPPVGALWYIRALFIYILLANCLVPLLSRKRIAPIVLIVFACLTVWQGVFVSISTSERLVSFMRWGFPFYGLLWFCVGIVFRRIEKFPRKLHAAGRYNVVILLLGALSVFCYYCPLMCNIWMCRIFRLIGTGLLMFSVWTLVGIFSVPRFLRSNIFPIYCLHWQVIALARHFSPAFDSVFRGGGGGQHLCLSVCGISASSRSVAAAEISPKCSFNCFRG